VGGHLVLPLPRDTTKWQVNSFFLFFCGKGHIFFFTIFNFNFFSQLNGHLIFPYQGTQLGGHLDFPFPRDTFIYLFSFLFNRVITQFSTSQGTQLSGHLDFPFPRDMTRCHLDRPFPMDTTFFS